MEESSLYIDLYNYIVELSSLEVVYNLSRCNKNLYNLTKNRLLSFKQDMDKYVTTAIELITIGVPYLGDSYTYQLYINPVRHGVSIKSIAKRLFKNLDAKTRNLLSSFMQGTKHNPDVLIDEVVINISYIKQYYRVRASYVYEYGKYGCKVARLLTPLEAKGNKGAEKLNHHPDNRKLIEKILRRAWFYNYTLDSTDFYPLSDKSIRFPPVCISRRVF